jgi:APA family basic amino acid/polyamine antiporter
LVAVGWSGYVVSFLKDFGIVIPPALSSAPFTYDNGWVATGAILNFPSVLIVALITSILVFGIRESVRVNNIIVIIKVVVILFFIGFGLSHINTENYVPFIPENTGEFGKFGWSGIFRAAGIIFLAFVGFDAISTVAQETKNPQKDMAIGILGSLAIVTVLYISVSLVLTGIVNYRLLNVPDPIAVGINAAGQKLFWLRPIIVGIIVSVISGLFPIDLIADMVSIGTLLAFAMVCISILILRVKRPDMHRPFKTPLVYFVTSVGAVGCLYLMTSLPVSTWERLVVWTVIGFLIYFLYGLKHSKLNNSAGNRRGNE